MLQYTDYVSVGSWFQFFFLVNLPYTPTPTLLTWHLFLEFPSAPKYDLLGTCGNLAELRKPRDESMTTSLLVL